MRGAMLTALMSIVLARGMVLSGTTFAAERAAAVSVQAAWSRATAPGASVGVAYFNISNAGAADSLVAIDSPAAQRAEMHSTTTGGSMQMRPVEFVEIPAGGYVAFTPGGLHVMLIDLKRPLTEGERLPLTLVFKRSGRVQVDAIVKGLGAMTPSVAQSSPTGYRLAIWPRHAQSPDFKLVDFNGKPRSLPDYRGKVLVMFFGFVHCPDACPAELFKLGLVMKQLGSSRERVQVLFVTLDPERDTRRVLKGYVTAFDPRFMGLTGTTAQVDRAAGNFYVEYARVGAGANYTIDHSTSTFVLDARGRLRLMGALDTSVDDYAHDLAALAAE
jgi:protein SCO1